MIEKSAKKEEPKVVVTLEDLPFTIPNFSNMTVEMVIATLGQIKRRISNLEKFEGSYEQALIAKLRAQGPGGIESPKALSEVMGEYTAMDDKQQKFIAKIEPASGQLRLNADKVRAFINHDENVYKTLCAMTESKGYKLTVKKGE
jgi:hypothetical protein